MVYWFLAVLVEYPSPRKPHAVLLQFYVRINNFFHRTDNATGVIVRTAVITAVCSIAVATITVTPFRWGWRNERSDSRHLRGAGLSVGRGTQDRIQDRSDFANCCAGWRQVHFGKRTVMN